MDTPGAAAVLWLNLQVQLLFLEQLREQLELELIDHQQWQLNRLRPAGIWENHAGKYLRNYKLRYEWENFVIYLLYDGYLVLLFQGIRIAILIIGDNRTRTTKQGWY